MKHSTKLAITWGAIILVVAAIFGPSAVSASVSVSEQQRLTEAKTQWASHLAQHYRLIVQHTHPGSIVCVQNVEVRDEEPVAIFQNTCSKPLPAESPVLQGISISSLFALATSMMNSVEGSCGGDCTCYGPIRVLLRYDPALGYPIAMRVGTLQLEQQIRLDYWINSNVLGGAGCPGFYYDGETFTVLSFTQLP